MRSSNHLWRRLQRRACWIPGVLFVAGIGLSVCAHGGTYYHARESGFWDAVPWNDGAGDRTGGLPENATATVGNHHTITYRGGPVNTTVSSIRLGASPPREGHARLVVESGELTVSGDLIAGRAASPNNAFIEVRSGALRVLGDAEFGRETERADGSLILSGGAFEVSGALWLGSFLNGGSMLRVHNPGSSPAVQTDSLILGRAALNLTYDIAYEHVPGEVITLVEYSSRDGQFGNFRDGDTFNSGRNRFRIDYDVPRDDRLSITITAVENHVTSETAPNIILILVDDQGYADYPLNARSQWARKFPMPQLERIADQGINFTSAYVTGGVCHPTRAGLLSGSYQQRYGSENNLGGPGYNGLPVSQRTIPERLQSVGYKTYGIGKWHLGRTVEYHPNVRGFDHWYGMWSGSRSYYKDVHPERIFQDQMTPAFGNESSEYLTDRIGDQTVEFIERHLAESRDDPFYMYVSLTAVHGPNDMDFSDPRFERLEEEFGLTEQNYRETPIIYGTRERTRRERYRLAGMTLALDENLGKILDTLDERGIAENTIIVYLNDNGGPGWTRQWGGNWSYNHPLRGTKGGSMTEGSIRVPGLMSWPGVIPGGQEVAEPVISLDFTTTFMRVAGAPDEELAGLDGVDLVPLLRDGQPLPEDRVLAWRHGGMHANGSALRMGDWKMLVNDNSKSAALFNLADDIGEANDLASDHPEILADLERRFAAWEAEMIPPLYGPGQMRHDQGLERHGMVGGYRLKSDRESLAWLSSRFRAGYCMEEDFHFQFHARPTERKWQPNAQLAYALGDSDNRGKFIRATIDHGGNQLRLDNGKSGISAATDLPSSPPLTFTEATLRYNADNRELTFTYHGASVSVVLGEGTQELTYFAVGAAAMEGELTTLVPLKQ